MKRPAAVVSAALLVFACKAEPAAEKKAPADTPSSAASKPTTQTKTQGARPASKPVVKTPGGAPPPVTNAVGEIPAPSDVAAAPKDAKTTQTGLAYKVLQAGDGAKPSATDKVKVHYTGWTTDGKMFDSSVNRGAPATFPLNRVIPGWTEGVQLMSVGEKTRFWIPEALAYKGRPGAPAGMLVFDVELLEITKPPPPIEAPKDVAAAPADAKKTATGLAYKVLSAGKSDRKPAATDTVVVHYTGWTTDGKMFDSSVQRGQPATFPLNRVIPGWTEGVQLMKIGDRTRFWIPEALAYKGRPGAPAGMLVFDVELLTIK